MIETLSEGEGRSQEEWLSFLQNSGLQFEALVDRGVLRKEGSQYVVRFVGICITDDVVWYCRPFGLAGAEKQALLQEIEWVDRILRTYESRSLRREAIGGDISPHLIEDEGSDLPTRELDLLASLLEWTQSYGFHEAEETRKVSGSERAANWPATINGSLPIITRSAALYLEPVSYTPIKRLSELGQLQAEALIGLFEKYRDVADYVFRFARDQVDEALEIVAEHQHYKVTDVQNFLRASYDSTNRDHDKDLIQLLISYFGDAARGYQRLGRIRLRGTRSFHLVWEDMCRAAIGMQAEVAGLFSNPVYRLGGERIYIDKQRPDIVYEEAGTTYVLDAKYYPRFPRSVPKLEDVRKQLFYGESCLRSSVRLAFLLPGKSSFVAEGMGTVRMEIDSSNDPRFDSVYCLKIDWKTVAESYVSRAPIQGLIQRLKGLVDHLSGL